MKHCPYCVLGGILRCSCDDYSFPGKVKQIMPEKCSLSKNHFYLKDTQSGIIDKGMAFESNFSLGEGEESGYGLNKRKFKEWEDFVAKHSIKSLESDKSNVTLNLDSNSIDKYTPLTIILDGESITLEHEDIKMLFHREEERKVSKLIDFMRDNGFKEKDILNVASNSRSESVSSVKINTKGKITINGKDVS